MTKFYLITSGDFEASTRKLLAGAKKDEGYAISLERTNGSKWMEKAEVPVLEIRADHTMHDRHWVVLEYF